MGRKPTQTIIFPPFDVAALEMRMGRSAPYDGAHVASGIVYLYLIAGPVVFLSLVTDMRGGIGRWRRLLVSVRHFVTISAHFPRMPSFE